MNFKQALSGLQEGDTVLLHGYKNPQIVQAVEDKKIFLCPYIGQFDRGTGIVKHIYQKDFISGIYVDGKIIYRDGFEKQVDTLQKP
jgi:hypothetical protein